MFNRVHEGPSEASKNDISDCPRGDEEGFQRAKGRYDFRVRGALPEAGDLVLVKLVGLTGKRKLADKWKSEPYQVIRKPDPAMPVYVVKRCDGEGHERTLHRNMFPLALPQADRTAD